jgi:hypothetical protein
MERKSLFDAIGEWFDGFVGSEEERAVADGLLDLVVAAEAAYDLSRPNWPQQFWYGVRDREMGGLRIALSDLKTALKPPNQEVTPAAQVREQPQEEVNANV